MTINRLQRLYQKPDIYQKITIGRLRLRAGTKECVEIDDTGNYFMEYQLRNEVLSSPEMDGWKLT